MARWQTTNTIPPLCHYQPQFETDHQKNARILAQEVRNQQDTQRPPVTDVTMENIHKMMQELYKAMSEKMVMENTALCAALKAENKTKRGSEHIPAQDILHAVNMKLLSMKVPAHIHFVNLRYNERGNPTGLTTAQTTAEAMLPRVKEICLQTALRFDGDISDISANQQWMYLKAHGVELARYYNDCGLNRIREEAIAGPSAIDLPFTPGWVSGPERMEYYSTSGSEKHSTIYFIQVLHFSGRYHKVESYRRVVGPETICPECCHWGNTTYGCATLEIVRCAICAESHLTINHKCPISGYRSSRESASFPDYKQAIAIARIERDEWREKEKDYELRRKMPEENGDSESHCSSETLEEIHEGEKTGAQQPDDLELYLGGKGMIHPAYDFQFSNVGELRQQRAAVGVRRDLGERIVVETRSDLVDHPYIQAIDIWELDSQQKKKRKTRLVNVYDNWVGEGQVFCGDRPERRRAIDDIDWKNVIKGRSIILGDFNAHSPYLNPACRHRQRADQLETIIDDYGLLVNNDTTVLGYLAAWTIDPDYVTPSDHELISSDLENPNNTIGSLRVSTATIGWDIRGMTEDQEKEAHKVWKEVSNHRPYLDNNSSKDKLENEAQWISDTLTMVLDQHSRKLRNKLQKTKKGVAETINIKQARDQCFERWIQGEDETYEPVSKDSTLKEIDLHRNKSNEDNLRCRKALRYTKEWATSVTLALKSQDGSIAVSIEEKENFVRVASFPTPPSDDQEPPEAIPGEAYNEVSKEVFYKAIYLQSVKKAPGPDRINFRAIRLLWSWDSRTITGMFRTAPVEVIVKEVGLRPSVSLWNNRQRRYAQRLLTLPKDIVLREILPETLREGDAYAQPGEQGSNLEWLSTRPKNLGQRLAFKLCEGTDIDPSFGIESTEKVKDCMFPGNVIVLQNHTDARNKAINHLEGRDELSIWTDGSKLENNRSTGVVWKMEDSKWHTRKVHLGKYREVVDAELARATSQATKQYLAQIQKINVWSDSKSTIMRIEHLRPGPGQWLARRIHENANRLQELGISVNVRWAPEHANIEGNEKADGVTKQAARNGRQCMERFASLAYVARLITERKWKESQIWFKKQH
ncbi:hypothetical protein EPUL_000062 [Erysiphe pulchra]|uniref:RNase H type-1 domain-containing protein n=1 Tax=Erysiphe pulchra TaxID=225359 RepID=A0A2S4Q2B6_9PEZI|nr:hypothetical protein EPUL_000062 [Erysiphe pulchra]